MLLVGGGHSSKTERVMCIIKRVIVFRCCADAVVEVKMVLHRGGTRAFCTIAQRRHVARRVEDVFCGGSGKALLSNAGRLGALYWASGGQGW